MFESLPSLQSARKRRRPALGAAIAAHSAAAVTTVLLSQWQVEAVSPPDHRPTYQFYVPVRLEAAEAPAFAGKAKADRTGPRATAPTVKQPATADPTTAPAPRDTTPGPAADLPAPGDPGGDGPAGLPGPPLGAGPAVPGSGGPQAAPPDQVYAAGAPEVVPALQLDCAPPEYSQAARTLHLQGEVVLEALIDTGGLATEIQVLSGNRILAGLALQSLSRCRFEPARLRGHPVRSRLRWTVAFTLR